LDTIGVKLFFMTSGLYVLGGSSSNVITVGFESLRVDGG
jgi:hypothetical protein